VKIVIVSSIPLLREGLASSLGSVEPDAEVMTEPSVTALYHRVSAQHLDVAVLDVMQGIDLDQVELIAAKFPGLMLLALGLPERREEFVRHGRGGFHSYVTRDASLSELQACLTDALARRLCRPPEIRGGLIRGLFHRRVVAAKPPSATISGWTSAIR
jgi:DNA-binding NarL/FixJ family response regulator